jgi:uroporphyrinogen III methyltransferase / synthase
VAETVPGSLVGKRIVITRAAAQSEALACELRERGAIPAVLPLVSFAEPKDFAPLDEALGQIDQFDWLILTSAQVVRAMMQRSVDLERPLVRTSGKLGIACVGPVTAEAARQAGLPVELVAKTHNGVALANELGGRIQGLKVLLPRSDRANPDLPAALKRYGAHVSEVIAYKTSQPTEVDRERWERILEGEADAVLFFSPSAVQNFAELFGAEKLLALQIKLAIIAVGPVTAKALHGVGVGQAVLAADTTAESVVETLEAHFAGSPNAERAGVKRG